MFGTFLTEPYYPIGRCIVDIFISRYDFYSIISLFYVSTFVRKILTSRLKLTRKGSTFWQLLVRRVGPNATPIDRVFFNTFKEYFDWRLIDTYTLMFRLKIRLDGYERYVNWTTLIDNEKRLNVYFEYDYYFRDWIDWSDGLGLYFTEDEIRELDGYIDIDVLLDMRKFSHDFLDDYSDRIDWKSIIFNIQYVNTDFIHRFFERLDHQILYNILCKTPFVHRLGPISFLHINIPSYTVRLPSRIRGHMWNLPITEQREMERYNSRVP